MYPKLGQCERCEADAVGFNDDGVALCEDCLFDDVCEADLDARIENGEEE